MNNPLKKTIQDFVRTAIDRAARLLEIRVTDSIFEPSVFIDDLEGSSITFGVEDNYYDFDWKFFVSSNTEFEIQLEEYKEDLLKQQLEAKIAKEKKAEKTKKKKIAELEAELAKLKGE